MKVGRKALKAAAAVYLACWALTWLRGPQDVEASIRRAWDEDSRFFDNPRPSTLDRVALVTGEGLPPAPWHFFGNAASPCPFLLRTDFAFRYRPAGSRGSHGYGSSGWCPWVFGWTVPLTGETYWSICARLAPCV
jgi:hypothetical protein